MRTRQLWVIATFLLLVVGVVMMVTTRPGLIKTQDLAFPDLMQRAKNGEVVTLMVRGDEFTGTLKDGSRFYTIGPERSDYYLQELEQAGVVPSFRADTGGVWLGWVLNALLIVMVAGFLMVMLRQMQGGAGKAMSFGKARAKLLNENSRRVTFEDVAGCDEAKEELQEIIQFLKDPRKFTRLGGRIPKGVLLMGSPGSGKTLLARAVAGEAGVPFFSISGSEFVEMFVGVGASRVRDLFEQAKRHAPCIIFIDEIDAVGRHRGTGMGGGHDEREQTLNQLLVEMDGFEASEGVILVAATNRPDVLDPALLRPGRFDRRVVVPAPDVRGRLGILQVHARRTPLAEDVDLERIARSTAGFSGADLENLINEAALLAARHDKKKVDQQDLDGARDKVAMGAERRSLVLTEAQKKQTAYHEAGHAIVARMVPDSDPVNKITIVPRGMALGITQQLPAEDRHNWSKNQIRSRIAVLMGGRVAQELVFQELDTGASNDIKQATRLATAFVCEWGMSPALGPVAWGERHEDQFLPGQFMPRQQDYSEDTAQRIDAEVTRLVLEGETMARSILTSNQHILHRVAQTLLEKETLDGVEFDSMVAGMDPVSPDLEPAA